MDSKSLYHLTPEEFERLVAALLAESGYSELRVVGGPGDKGIDIVGMYHNQPVAIQARHKMRLNPGEIEKFVQTYFKDPSTPRSLVFVTSAEVSPLAHQIVSQLPNGCKFQFLGRQDILNMLSTHRHIAQRFFGVAEKRQISLRRQLQAGVLGLASSILAAVIYSSLSFFFPHAPLDERIKTVENAITNIRDLETYLDRIKEDMVATEKATQVLNTKYAQAKELEKLTEDQVNALRATLQAESWHRTIFNYIIGFIFGVASSFVASVLYTKWQQRKALE